MSFLDEFQDFRHPHKNVKKFKKTNYHVDDLDQNFTFNCTRTYFCTIVNILKFWELDSDQIDDAQKHAAHRIF